MYRFELKSPLALVLVAASTLILSACQTTGGTSASDAEPAVAAAETESAPLPADDYQGDGMLLTLDGSDLDAFNASLDRIGRHTDEPTFESLKNAIQYLIVYDISAQADPEILAARLDGKTGYEVMELVNWRKPPKSRSRAEKDSDKATL